MGPVVDAALTAVMVVTPTAMYLGLWRLLMRMRDDELINRLDRRMREAEPDRANRPGAPAAVGLPALDASDLDPDLDDRLARRMRRRGEMTQCPDCRTLNGPRDETCHACGTELDRSRGSGVLSRLGR